MPIDDTILYCAIVVSAIMALMITGYTCVAMFYCCKNGVQDKVKQRRTDHRLQHQQCSNSSLPKEVKMYHRWKESLLLVKDHRNTVSFSHSLTRGHMI